jgi:hypothetical protein
MRMTKIYFAGLVLISTGLVSCSDNDQLAKLEVRLTDAPGDYQEVNVDIQDVQIHVNEGEQSIAGDQ